jgi:hypothetical protein
MINEQVVTETLKTLDPGHPLQINLSSRRFLKGKLGGKQTWTNQVFYIADGNLRVFKVLF